jgi:hypothetical protein
MNPQMAGNQVKYSIELKLQGLIKNTTIISCAVEPETYVHRPWNKNRYDFTQNRYDFTENEASRYPFCVI